MREDYTKEVELLASLYSNSSYKVLKKWLEERIEAGFSKMLKKRTEETRGELAAELRAYKTVLNHVEDAFKQSRQVEGNLPERHYTA